MKTKITLLFLIGIMLLVNQLEAQSINRYNGQGDYSDRFTAIQTDASGNVYLAGSTIRSGNNQDILVVKLDSNGNLIWQNIYNASASGADSALAITVDTAGNVYITGYAKFLQTATDMVTIKYNSLGVIQWVSNYNYVSDQYEQGNSIVVDASGNVFVTGQSDPDSTTTVSDDYVVVKYNSMGVQQWVQRTNGTGNGIDRPSKIVLDPAGNPVVTGRSDNLVNYDYLTVKYNGTTGVPLWSVRYDRTHNDWATDLIINPNNGFIYVTGRSRDINYDYATVCYDSAGVQQWATIYDNGIGDDRATNIGVDSGGNIYVTGQSNISSNVSVSNYDITTIKYNSAGTQQWLKTHSGTALNDDIPNGFYVSAAGNVFVTGSVDTDASANENNDYVTLKYNTTGTLQWSQSYTGSSLSNDVSRAIVEDSSGNVIVTGYTETIPQKDCVTLKYNSLGIVQWTKTLNGEGDNSDKPTSMISDSNGNIFVAGSVVEYGNDKDFALQKMDSNGNTLWVKTINGTAAGSSDSAEDVIVDNTGTYIYVAGYTHNKGTATDFTIAKYNQLGTLIWVNNYDYASETDRALSIGLDTSGNVYVTGKSDSDPSNLITNDDILTVKYNSDGIFQWATRYNGAGNLSDIGRVLKVTPAGNIYVAGKSTNSTNSDYIILKYNTSGVQQWVNLYNGGGNDDALQMEIDASENLYITGNSDNASLTNTDIVTLKINSAGVQQWAKRLDGGNDDVAKAIKIDALGNVVVAGTSDTDNLSTTINNNITLVKYDNNSNQQWLNNYNGTANADDQASDIAIDNSNNIYLTGTTNGVANYDYATIKYTPTGGLSNVLIYNGTANGSDIPKAIIYKDNFVYVTGSSFGVNAQSDFTTLRYSSSCSGIPNTFALAANPLPKITTQPTNTILCNALGSQSVISVATNLEIPIYQWQFRVITTTSPNPIWITITSANAGAVYTNYTTASLNITRATTLLPATGSEYRVIVTNPCGIYTSVTAKLNIIGTTKAGTIISSPTVPTVCSGKTILFTLSGYVGTSIQWQTASTLGAAATLTTPAIPSDWSDISEATSTTYTTAVLTTASNKYYRAIVTNSCDNTTAITATKTITVNPPSNGGIVGVTVGTTFIDRLQVCSGSSTIYTITDKNYVGTIQWEYSIDNGATWSNVPAGTSTIPFVGTAFTTTSTGKSATYIVYSFTQDTRFRVTVKSGVCSSAISTNYVACTITTAVATSVSAVNATVCSGTSTTLTLASGYVGVIKWLKSTTDWATFSTVVGTNPTLSTGNLTIATAFKAVLTVGGGTGPCVAETASITVGIYAKPIAKAITSPTSSGTATLPICTSDTKVLNITTGYIADTILWEKAVVALTATTAPLASDYTSISGATGSSYTVNGASAGKNYFRAKFIKDGCLNTAVYSVFIVYYKDCSVVRMIEPISTVAPFEVVAYPNPYKENFKLSVTTLSQEKVRITVYDMIGKLIELREVKPSEISELQIGDTYSMGVYNIVLNQGVEQKTIRVIKK